MFERFFIKPLKIALWGVLNFFSMSFYLVVLRCRSS